MLPARKPNLSVVPPVVAPLPKKPKEPKVFLNPNELVARWHHAVKRQTLANWRNPAVNRGPRFYKIGGKVLYDIEDIEAYELENSVTPSGKPLVTP